MKKVILMLAVAAMASCSKSEVETRPVETGDVEIVSGSKVITRSPFEGTLDDKANNSLTAYVYATKLDVANSNAYVDYKPANVAAKGYMKFVSAGSPTGTDYPVAAVGFTKEDGTSDPQYYPMDNNPMYMVGLIPSTIDSWTLDNDCKNATYQIDGKTDIMADAVTKMNDGSSLIQKNNASATVYPAFEFKHKLTLVNVKAYAETAEQQAAFGKIIKIEVFAVNGHADGVDNVCSIELENGTATATGYAAGNTTRFYYCNKATGASTITYGDLLVSSDAEKTADATKNYGPVEIPAPATGVATKYTAANADYVAYAMIAPFTATATGANPVNLKLKVYTEKNPTTGSVATISALYSSTLSYDGSGNITNTDYYTGSTEGKMFDVTLKFLGREIMASATVKDWENIYTGEAVVE